MCIRSSGEETWVHHFTPTSKQTTMQWKHPGSSRKRYKVTLSAGKYWPLSSWTKLVCCWWNSWNRNSKLCNMLQSSREAIRSKHPALSCKGVIILMTLSYCTQHERLGTCCKILGGKWTFPYSVQIWHPLTFMFPTMKENMSGHCFTCGKATRRATIV